MSQTKIVVIPFKKLLIGVVIAAIVIAFVIFAVIRLGSNGSDNSRNTTKPKSSTVNASASSFPSCCASVTRFSAYVCASAPVSIYSVFTYPVTSPDSTAVHSPTGPVIFAAYPGYSFPTYSLSFVGCYGNGSANLCDGKNSHKNRVRP